MPPTSFQPPYGVPSQERDLTLDEKLRVEVLWRTFFRVLVDVRPTAEHKIKLPESACRYIHGLHQFATAVLEHALRHYNESCLVRENDSSPQHCSAHVKPACETSLREFLDFALQRTSPSSKERCISIRPAGRVVIQIHLEDLLMELREFELQGQQPTPDYTRNSYGAYLYHFSKQALAAIGCALSLAITTVKLREVSKQNPDASTMAQLHSDFSDFVNATQLVVRFLHVKPAVHMMDVKTCLVGKFVSVKGHIVKARPKKLRLATADFSCQKCGTVITHAFEAGRYSAPTSCAGESCSSRTLTMQRSTARYINIQELRLQECQDESTVHAGRAPRQLVVEVSNDLVESATCGDMVQVAARIEAVNTALASGQRGKRVQETSTYQLFLNGHSISTLSENKNFHKNRRKSRHKFTQEQLQNITQLCHADHRHFSLMERRAFPFDLLVRSLCPAIIGHNEVKAGLLLCLLGGTQTADRTNSIRYNSHMLIVGDPGMGKSQMLLATSQVASRAVYVGGNTSSTTGLTVTLAKEDKGGQSTIEAGALVLADQGICCIDEFDKMAKNNQDGLLEAMEQQQVSIAKAGVVASLPARCSLIAAANPKQGTYDMNKTVSENLNMARPILSRFDLVFILRDKADSELDRMVSSNIMNLYRKDVPGRSAVAPSIAAIAPTSEHHHEMGSHDTRIPLSERLAWATEMQKQPLPADLVRDYIAYAREYCRPKLSKDAAKILKNYFMELRYPADGRRRADTVPITTRQLEALIRLCQARAKACLRELCLEEDALDVVDLMKYSVEQVHKDEAGIVDPIRGGAGGTSMRKAKKAFLNEIRVYFPKGGKASMDDLRRIADRAKVGLDGFDRLIDALREDMVLLKTSDGHYDIKF